MSSPYSNTPYAMADAVGTFQPRSRRFGARVARFAFRLILFAVILAALGGVVFALYRNDVLLTAARGAGLESQYLELEGRLVGMPGWGTPRSIVLPADGAIALAPTPRKALDTAHADAPSSELGGTAKPRDSALGETNGATAEGLPIVSLDALPKLPSKSEEAAAAPISLDALPEAAPPSRARAAPARTVRASSDAKREAPRQVKASVPARSVAPAPVAKQEPAAEPAKPEPPAVAAPRRKDNPLTAAIRSAVIKQPPAE